MTIEDEIAEKIFDVMTPRCPKCKTKLSPYPCYGNRGEVFRICPNCNEKVVE